MSHVQSKERRYSIRVPGSYPVLLRDARRRVIGRGKTANISERGLFLLLPGGRKLAPAADVQVEMDLPRSPASPRSTRTVRYRARVVRVVAMGKWQGVGLELAEKLP